jgi:hypothetical protein
MFSDLRSLTLRDTSCRHGNLVAYRAKRPSRHPNRLWVHGLALLWQIVSFAVIYRIPESIFQ